MEQAPTIAPLPIFTPGMTVHDSQSHALCPISTGLDGLYPVVLMK
jgi:hypothetical protein